MPILIDADEALRMIRNSKADNPFRDGNESFIWRTAHDCAISCVEDTPTIDAEPVKHGEWEPSPHLYGYVRCSECHDCNVWNEWIDGKKWNFCPNCGADMRERMET